MNKKIITQSTDDWFLFEKVRSCSLMQSVCAWEGMVKYLKKNIGQKLTKAVFHYEHNELWIYFLESDYKKIGQILFIRLLENIHYLDPFLNQIKNLSTALFHFSRNISKFNPRGLTNSKIAAYYRQVHEIHHWDWIYGMIPHFLEYQNNYLSGYLKEYLVKRIREEKLKKTSEEILPLLIYQSKKTLAKQAEIDLWKLLLSLKKNKRLAPKIVQHYHQKYCWFTYNWQGPAQTMEELNKTIKKYQNPKINPITEIRKIVSFEQKVKEEKRKIIKQLKINSKHLYLLNVLGQIVYLKEYRNNASYFANYVLEPYYLEVARRFGLSLKQIWACYCTDFNHYVRKGHFPVKYLTQTAKNYLLYFDGKRIRKIFNGSKIKKIVTEIKVHLKRHQLKEVKGQCAYHGRANGKVVVINKPEELSKMRTNRILVSHVTDPTLVPAMKKAQAIVTDVGGLSCHAAIISRELKVPCVIGTKIATQVLKDGDIVEVDATKGIVRKLKQ